MAEDRTVIYEVEDHPTKPGVKRVVKPVK